MSLITMEYLEGETLDLETSQQWAMFVVESVEHFVGSDGSGVQVNLKEGE